MTIPYMINGSHLPKPDSHVMPICCYLVLRGPIVAELWAGPIIVAQMGLRETTNGDDQWQCGGIDLKFLWAGSVSWCVSVYLWAPHDTPCSLELRCVFR